jgi:hypothetical protein
VPRKPDRKDKLGDKLRARLVIMHKINNGKFLPHCAVAFMRELIDHASYETGACFPAETLCSTIASLAMPRQPFEGSRPHNPGATSMRLHMKCIISGGSISAPMPINSISR